MGRNISASEIRTYDYKQKKCLGLLNLLLEELDDAVSERAFTKPTRDNFEEIRKTVICALKHCHTMHSARD